MDEKFTDTSPSKGSNVTEAPETDDEFEPLLENQPFLWAMSRAIPLIVVVAVGIAGVNAVVSLPPWVMDYAVPPLGGLIFAVFYVYAQRG